jgi:Kef-type K+ transport system membrane component KefB
LLALAGVGASFLGGLGLGLAVGWPPLWATFLGLILTSTSTTLSLKLLADSGFGAVSGAEIVTASILIDDIVALSFMTIVVGLAAPSPLPPLTLVAGLAGILGLAALLVFLGRHALPPILRATDAVSPPSVVLFAVSFGLLISFAFAVLGLPPLIGAFFAGSIIASTEYGPRVSRHITPVAALFMGVFFASIGFLIDPARIPGVLILSLATVGVATLAKFIPGVLILRRTARVRAGAAWPLAAFLIPRAEISLIIAQYGISVGVTPDLLAIAMAVMVGTAILPAPLLSQAKRRLSAPRAGSAP